jgi:hypothetical protein
MAFLIPFTSIAPSFAKNFNTWEELDSDRQGISDAVDPYMPVAEIGEACVDSFEKSPSYAGLANQLFIFPPHENDNSKEYFLWSAQSRKLQGEISNHSIDWTDLYWLRSEATQIYINQLIYNWRLQKEIFRHETHIDAGDMADFPEVKKAIAYAADVRKKQQEQQISIPDSWNEKELIKHAQAFNSMVQEINILCSESKIVYDRMMVVYNDSQLQNWETNEYLPILLGSQEENALVDGGIKGIIRKRNGEIRAIASWEAGLYTGVMSQTMFGKMYSAHNSALRNHVGTYNQKSCVEYGRQLKQLPETKEQLWKLIGSSYATVHHEFQKDLREVIENAKETTTQKLLEDYVESNPTSIQQALWAKPSVGRAKSVCKVLQNFHESKTAKAALLEMLTPITMLASFMTAGAASGVTGSIIAYSALVLNSYFIGSTVMDLVVSRDLEDRIQGALLSNQIDAATGEDMMNQLQASRPFSYLNIALSGLGATAAVSRLSKISKTARYEKYKQYMDAKGGATPKKFAAAQKAYFGKQIKTGTLTRAKIKQTAAKIKGPEPKGVKHDMGAETLRDYLKFAQSEADAGTGIVKTGPDTFIKPSTNPTGGAQGGATSMVGTSSNGKPSIGAQRVTQSSKPVITKPSAIASTTSKTSGTNNAPINLVKTNPPKTSQSATTALIPQTKIYVEEDESELDPNIVPMPVKPDVVVPPVWPSVVEPSIGNERNRKDLRKILEKRKELDRKQAEQVIENDLTENNAIIISIIEGIAQGLDDLAKKARNWLSKHGGLGRGHYDGSASIFIDDAGDFKLPNENGDRPHRTESTVFSDRRRMVEFEEIERKYGLLMEDLDDRRDFLRYILEDKIIEPLDTNIYSNLMYKFDKNLSNPFVKGFNLAVEVIGYQNAEILQDLQSLLTQKGFSSRVISTSNGLKGLEIAPSVTTKFLQTLKRYLKTDSFEDLVKYRFIYNPVDLHIHSAAAQVTGGKEVEFGLGTVKSILLNEFDSTDRHEIRHMFMHALRDEKKESIYHQRYHFEQGDLNSTDTYKHYVSAEEIYAYATNFNDIAAELHAFLEPNRRAINSRTLEEILEDLHSYISTTFLINKGILKSSHRFLQSINDRNFKSISTVGGNQYSIEIELDSGEMLSKSFVNQYERNIFNLYVENHAKYENLILAKMYKEQLRLNHLAYMQMMMALVLNNSLLRSFEYIESDIDLFIQDYIRNNSNATIDEVSLMTEKVKNEFNYYSKIKNIVDLLRKMHRSTKENSKDFLDVAQEMDDKYWPLVVHDQFRSSGVNSKTEETITPRESSQSSVRSSSKPSEKNVGGEKNLLTNQELKLPSNETKATQNAQEISVINIASSSVANSANVYGDEQFLDHLKFDVEDLNESRQNPLVLFRGLSKFYENTGVTQKELETFTRWVIERFSFSPFWGRNKHGNDWGYSYLQMWPKSNFANSNVGIQFDLVFLVNQKSEPFVVIRLPGHQKEVLYNFKDLVSHIDEFIQPNNLIPGRVYTQNTYYSLITGAQYDTKEKTTWERDEYEDIPEPPMIQYIPKVESREAGSDHIQFHPSEPVSERIKNLGNKNSKASEFLQKLIGYEVTISQLKSRPVVESGHFQSTRFLDFGPNEGYYYKIYQDSKVKKPFTNEVGDDPISEYELTDLEYAVYLADQKLNERYPNVFLIEIDGKKVFFIKKMNEVLFNFKNLDEKVYKNKTKESMDELFKNFLAANILDVDQLKVVYKGSVNYSLPDDVVLFDFLLGIDDRHLTRNVLLSSDDIWNVVDEKFPLDISTRKYDLLIYDGGRAFSFEPNKMIQNGSNFFRWYGGYHYDYDQNMLNIAQSELKRLLINSPEFSNRLAQWTPDQIKSDLHYLSDAHMTHFLQNRQFILDLALEAGVFAPTNNRPVPPAVLDDGAVASQASSTFDKEGSPSGGKGDELSPQYSAAEILSLAKSVVRGEAVFSQIQPESKRQMVRKEIDKIYFDKTSAYSGLALKWYEKNRITPPTRQVESPEVAEGKQFLDQWSQNNDQPVPSALIRSVIESFSLTDGHPYQELSKRYEKYLSENPKKIVVSQVDQTQAATIIEVVQRAEKKTTKQATSGPVWKVDENKVDNLIKDATKGNKSLSIIEAYFKTLSHEKLANYQAFDALVRPYVQNEVLEKEILSLYRYIFSSTIPKTIMRDKLLLTFEHYFKIKHPEIYTLEFQNQFNQWIMGQMSTSNTETQTSSALPNTTTSENLADVTPKNIDEASKHSGETFDKEGSPSGGKGDQIELTYNVLSQFPVEPDTFVQWSEKLPHLLNDKGIVQANPFTHAEILKLTSRFQKDVDKSVADGDPVAVGSVRHMEEHMENVDKYKAELQQMGINIEYFRLLVFLHDAGKFIPSARVLKLANGNFLKGRIVWHDQSTTEYLLKIGSELSIDSKKAAHLIADIIGHNDGSGLDGIFWTAVFPGYPLPRRLEGDLLAMFDRFGQGNFDGARKILPNTRSNVFFEKVKDAYYESPANTIRQLDLIYQRALKRLEERSKIDSTINFANASQHLKKIFTYAVDAQKTTMEAYRKLKWSNDNTICSIELNGKILTASTIEQFLEKNFQDLLITQNPSSTFDKESFPSTGKGNAEEINLTPLDGKEENTARGGVDYKPLDASYFDYNSHEKIINQIIKINESEWSKIARKEYGSLADEYLFRVNQLNPMWISLIADPGVVQYLPEFESWVLKNPEVRTLNVIEVKEKFSNFMGTVGVYRGLSLTDAELKAVLAEGVFPRRFYFEFEGRGFEPDMLRAGIANDISKQFGNTAGFTLSVTSEPLIAISILDMPKFGNIRSDMGFEPYASMSDVPESFNSDSERNKYLISIRLPKIQVLRHGELIRADHSTLQEKYDRKQFLEIYRGSDLPLTFPMSSKVESFAIGGIGVSQIVWIKKIPLEVEKMNYHINVDHWSFHKADQSERADQAFQQIVPMLQSIYPLNDGINAAKR